jgi:hypothetical protein
MHNPGLLQGSPERPGPQDVPFLLGSGGHLRHSLGSLGTGRGRLHCFLVQPHVCAGLKGLRFGEDCVVCGGCGGDELGPPSLDRTGWGSEIHYVEKKCP